MQSSTVQVAKAIGSLSRGRKGKPLDLFLLSERRIRSRLNPDRVEKRSVFMNKYIHYIKGICLRASGLYSTWPTVHRFMETGRSIDCRGGRLWNNILVKAETQNLAKAEAELDQRMCYGYSKREWLWGSEGTFLPIACSIYCNATVRRAVLLIKNCWKVGQSGHLPCCLLTETNNTGNNNGGNWRQHKFKSAIFSWH